MKSLAIFIILLYAINIKADTNTAENLIKKYGKEAIMKEIAHKVGNKFTIYVDNNTRLVPAPSTEFVTPWTLAADIERSGMTIQSVERMLLERQAEKDRLAAEEMSRQAALEKQRQDQQKYRDEDIKFFAEASEKEREIFRQARLRGLQQKLNREEQNIKPEQPTYQRQKITNYQQANHNPICAINRDKISADLKNEYSSRYPNSYNTQEMLYKAGIEDYDYLCGLTMGSVEIGIINELLSRYYPNMSTIRLLYTSNLKAYQRLQLHQ